MKLQEFGKLKQKEQIDILHRHAVYIGKKKRHFLTTLLFQLDAFYVEVQYSRYRQVVEQVYCTASTSVVDAYLDQIDVAALVRC